MVMPMGKVLSLSEIVYWLGKFGFACVNSQLTKFRETVCKETGKDICKARLKKRCA